VESLFRLLDDTEGALDRARKSLSGPEKRAVMDDLDDEADRIDETLAELLGPAPEARPRPKPVVAPTEVDFVRLQLSWTDGRILAWAGGLGNDPESHEHVLKRLADHGGGAITWQQGDDLDLPGGVKAPSVSAPLASTLGWLVPLGSMRGDDSLGASVIWMGAITAAAVAQTSQGRMVPQLHQIKSGPKRNDGKSLFHVRWSPASVNAQMLNQLIESTPGTVMVANNGDQDRQKFAPTVLADLVDAIVRTAASHIEFPASPPDPHSRGDVGEALLARLDGTAFTAPTRSGNEVVRRLQQWAAPVIAAAKLQLVVQLDPPDDIGAWLARVLVPDDKGVLEPAEVTLTTGSDSRRKQVNKEIGRLERLFPELLRPGGRRRGEVILSQDEAWSLMTDVGAKLAAAGFDVRVPELSRRKPSPSLRLTAESTDSVVGARQLANVSWSAVFDDLELSAADISRLASEARPLVQSRGKWVELDKVDLAAAAQALAERANQAQLTGAEMLRHALGLEGPALGGITLAGSGWAADLLRSVNDLPEPDATPDGFKGELRSYQADALAWLNFLDTAGLGGCLALDMGLGKTPTTLASLALSTDAGPGLVVAPPAVVGNWRSEAAKFTPGTSVLVHHGPNRAKGSALTKAIGAVDVVITTYGTAVRDIDQLEKVQWGKVVLDEAQAIKNPAADMSQQLRRLEAHTRVALTGTPIENGLGDLWSILDWANPGLLGSRNQFIAQLSPDRTKADRTGEGAMKALNGILVYRRTKSEPEIAAELPDRIDELDHCAMTPEQIGLYQAVLDNLVAVSETSDDSQRQKGAVLAAITALKQICNHPVNYRADDRGLEGRSGKLDRLNEILETVFAADERVLIFTHFATWGDRLADYLTTKHNLPIPCYHGGLGRTTRDRMVDTFQNGKGKGAMVLSLKAGGTGLNLTAANHVVLYDRWWNPAVEDQARDRVWRIGQKNTVIAHRLVCPGTVDERVEEVVAGKRHIADVVLPKASSLEDLDAEQLRKALGIDTEAMLSTDADEPTAVPS
jgi:hypothetical protein